MSVYPASHNSSGIDSFSEEEPNPFGGATDPLDAVRILMDILTDEKAADQRRAQRQKGDYAQQSALNQALLRQLDDIRQNARSPHLRRSEPFSRVTLLVLVLWESYLA